MNVLRLPSRSLRITLAVAVCGACVLGVTLLPNASSSAGAEHAQSATGDSASKPTIVLVHGAFADSSSWSSEIQSLQERGYTVHAPANPLRGLAGDSDHLRLYLSTIRGPIVLVGHSYGGALITNAATGNPNVKALVYVAAYVPQEGETLAAAGALGGGVSMLPANLVVRPFPGAALGDGDGYVNPQAFSEVFAKDLPLRQSAVLAASQRPIVLSALATPSGEPAWKTIPSWALVATDDNAIPAVAERAMAKRAGAHVIEIHSSHVALISNPAAVTDLILAAATSY